MKFNTSFTLIIDLDASSLLFIVIIIYNNMEEVITNLYNELKELKGGKVADYIPQLASVNSELFGISVCTVDGNIFNIGDCNVHFCLQSCSKPLSYCIVHDSLGGEKIHNHVGYEPSGREFNAFILNKKGLPHNPLINAGAIMVASLIDSDKEPSHRFNTIKDYYSRMAGNLDIVGFDNSVFLSEQHHADRNISLAYYMRENGAFKNISPNEITESLNLYFQQCSTTITCSMGSVIASTLANGGICPITNEKIVSTDAVQDCLTLMYGCGMYDYTGQFAFEVGLPAKSGVSGCILLVIPNKMGICIWSPPLDDQGNSFKGIEFCKRISKSMKLHIFHNMVSNNIDFSNTYNLTNRFISMCSTGDLENIKKIIDKVDVNCCDYDKRTPLHLAAAEGYVDIVKLLINKGAKNNKDRWGNTPLSEIVNKTDENYNSIRNLLT